MMCAMVSSRSGCGCELPVTIALFEMCLEIRKGLVGGGFVPPFAARDFEEACLADDRISQAHQSRFGWGIATVNRKCFSSPELFE
jgi:hypothetical protein